MSNRIVPDPIRMESRWRGAQMMHIRSPEKSPLITSKASINNDEGRPRALSATVSFNVGAREETVFDGACHSCTHRKDAYLTSTHLCIRSSVECALITHKYLTTSWKSRLHESALVGHLSSRTTQRHCSGVVRLKQLAHCVLTSS